MKKRTKIFLIMFFLFVFLLSLFKIVIYFIEANESREVNNRLIEDSVVIIKENNSDNTSIDINFNSLKEINNDIVGWIYIENTSVNYPVVQASDNNYYLYRLINGETNNSGSIFMDCRNNASLTDRNTIIYGHSMKNGTMFAPLINYRNQNFYENHKNVYCCTPERNYKIELFAGLTIDDDSFIYNLSYLDENTIEYLKGKSDFKTNVDVTNEDKIITLSTCAYEYQNARYILMGVLKED